MTREDAFRRRWRAVLAEGAFMTDPHEVWSLLVATLADTGERMVEVGDARSSAVMLVLHHLTCLLGYRLGYLDRAKFAQISTVIEEGIAAAMRESVL